jgi:hypothetical protein
MRHPGGPTRPRSPRCTGIPLSISNKPAKFYLGFFMHLEADNEQRYMMVKQSMTMVVLDADLPRELLHYDYERDKNKDEKGYPEGHLQICASSGDWDIACQRSGQEALPLSKMHLPIGPVGGGRFRPSLEDVIEFLIVEELVESRTDWKAALDKTRRPFQELQLKAAVRRNQELAVDALRAEGWTVTRDDT